MQSIAATVMKSTTACWFILEILGFCLSLQLCNLGCGSSGGGASDLLNQRMLTGFLCSGPASFIILAGSKVTLFVLASSCFVAAEGEGTELESLNKL